MASGIDQVSRICRVKAGVTEEYPFDPETRVFKVLGRMFALIALDATPPFVNLKCDPEDSLALRAQYDAIVPGYHMDKRLWISVFLDGRLPDELIRELIDQSYELVVAKLPKKKQRELQGLAEGD